MPLTYILHRLFAKLDSQPVLLFVSVVPITLIGALLRFYKLGAWSFWGDEMFTVSGHEDGFNYNLIRKSLSLALIQGVVDLRGLNEWNARLVPAAIGVITVVVFFFLARKLFDIPTALLAASLLALSPWHLYWSQNARFYTALLLFYSLCLFYFYLGVEEDNPRYLLLCLIFLGLAVKERLLALFFLPVILFYIFLLSSLHFDKPRGWNYRNVALFIMSGVLGSLFFIGPYLLNLGDWMSVSGFGFSNNSPFWLAGGFAYYVGLPVICIGGTGGIYLIMQKSRVGLFLFLNAVVPPFILFVISPFHYTANRYIFISLTSWLLLAAVTVVMIIKNLNWPVKLSALGVLFILLAHPISEDALYFLKQNGNRDNWSAAFAYVQSHAKPGDMVVSGNLQLADYYMSLPSISIDQIHVNEFETIDNRIWFVEDMTSAQKYPEIDSWFTQNARLVSLYDVYFQARNFSMRVYLYDPLSKPMQES